MELSYKEFAGLIVKMAESIATAPEQKKQMIKPSIAPKMNFTKKQIGLIEDMYDGFAVSITTKGNIKIAKSYDEPKHWFVIGKNKMGYWVRQYKVSKTWGGVNVWRPNLKNGKYTFASFEDAVDYFDKRLSWKL